MQTRRKAAVGKAMAMRMSTQDPKQKKSFWRLAFYTLGGVCLVGVGAGAAAWYAVRHIDLASLASSKGSAMLGRKLTIEALHVTPGVWVGVRLQNTHLANVEGGSAPDMVQIGTFSAEVKLSSLLSGPMLVRHVQAQNVHVLVERTPQNMPNWRFKKQNITQQVPVASGTVSPPAKQEAQLPPRASALPAPPVAQERAGYPTVLDAEISDSDVTYRTAHGVSYRAGLHQVRMQTASAESPVTLHVEGAYNTLPVQITAEMQPFSALRHVHTPYGLEAHIASGDLQVQFKGTATDPINADGLAGTVQVETPTSESLAAVVGYALPGSMPLHMAGQFVHSGNFWQLTQGKGAVKGNRFTLALAELNEGTHAQPDHVKTDLAFDTLNMNSLLAKGAITDKNSATTDLPLSVSLTPDPLVEARLVAKAIQYNVYTLNDVTLLASVMPGIMAVQELRVGYLGATLVASGKLETAVKNTAHIQAKAAVSGVDIEAYRRALGFKPVPLSGRAALQMTFEATQPTLNTAMQHATIAAAVGMTGGALQSEIIRAASADLGLLFHKAKGTTPVECLLGVVSAQNGVGQILPLRIKTEQGTLSANALFNINTRWFDLTFATQKATTGRFALDIPVRVSGNFGSPHIGLANLSASGRKMLAQSERLTSLPDGVKQFAQRNSCYRAIAQ